MKEITVVVKNLQICKKVEFLFDFYVCFSYKGTLHRKYYLLRMINLHFFGLLYLYNYKILGKFYVQGKLRNHST